MTRKAGLLVATGALIVALLMVLSTTAGGVLPTSARLARLATPTVDFGAPPSGQLAPVEQSFIQRQLGFTPGPAATGSTTLATEKKFACVGGRQTADPLSPPCDTSESTANDGATFQGVTSDEIRVAVVAFGGHTFPCGMQDAPCVEGQNRETPRNKWFDLDDPANRSVMFARGMQAYADYFNSRYQTFGRRVHLFLYFFDSATYYNPEGSKQSAKDVIDALRPAAIVLESPQNSDFIASEFARRGVPVFTDLWEPRQTESFYAKYPDRLWGYWPSVERSAEIYAQYVCKKVAPNPVSMSGVAGANGKPRKLGLIYGQYHDTLVNKQTADEVIKRVKACGVEIADVGSFVNGNGCSDGDFRHTPTADLEVMTRFQLKGITTVLWPTCISESIALAAAYTGYKPEWVVLGDYSFDANGPVWAAGLTNLFHRHAVIVTPATVEPPLRLKRCYQALHSADPGISDFDAFWVCRNYGNFQQLFTGIQLAGPSFGPASLGRGLRSLPEVASADAFSPTCSYAADNTCVKDAMVMWWDAFKPTKYNGANNTGCWRVMEKGKRYLPNAWPAGNIDAAISDTDACNAHDNDFRGGQYLPDRYHVTSGIPGLPETLPVATERTARNADQMTVTLGSPASKDYERLLVAQQNTEPFRDLTYYAPSDCASIQRSSCDLITLRLDKPAAAAGKDLQLDTTLTWDDSRGNQLQYQIWDLRTAPDGTKYWGITHRGEEGKSPSRLLVSNPAETQYLIRVMNVGGTNRGYTLSALLTQPDLVLPTDLSTFDRAAKPATTVVDTILPLIPRLSDDTSFPLGESLAVKASRPVAASDGSGSTTWPWTALLGAVVAVTVLGGLRVSRARDLRLVWKLLLPFLVIILVGGMTAAFLMTRYLSTRASNELDQSLLQRSVGAASYLRDQESVLVQAQRFAANTQGVPDAVATKNATKAATAMSSALAVNNELDLLAAVSTDATGLAEFTRRDGQFVQSEASSFVGSTAVARTLRSTDIAAVGAPEILQVDGVAMLTTAGPVVRENVVGAMVSGVRLDTIAQSMAQRIDGSVAIYDAAGKRMASSADRFFSSTLPAGASDRGEPVRLRNHAGGRGQATIYSAVNDGGAFLGTIAVSLPTGPAYAAVAGARVQLILISLLVMAAVVAFGVFVSRSVLSRVDRLVETNRALGAGDLSVRAPELGRDELGELGVGFNVMAEQLQASYADMERRVDQRTEELQRMYQDVVRGNEARSDLFASISHEFRTPIFAILAHAELMTDPHLRPGGKAWVSEFGDTISEAANSLLHRVDDILELAKLESTEFELHVAPFDLAALVSRIEPQVAALARQSDLTFSASVPSGLPALHADERRVEQILLNLLSNAIKYNRAGGSVTLEAAPDRGGVVLRVSDTGVGIERKNAKRVFEPFYRVAGAPTRHSSSGLGLALAKRLAEAQGGSISFTSKPGVGTTFSVVLPTS